MDKARLLRDARTSEVLDVLRRTTAEVRDRREAMRCASDHVLATIPAETDSTVDVIQVAAVVLELVDRRLGIELVDAQVMAGLAMSAGWTVQMRTGEGKTFAGIIPAAFHARSGRKVHVVTANDYLAGRDEHWVGGILRALGLTTAVIAPAMPRVDARAAYSADVVYSAGPNLGFDFLRDNLGLGDESVQSGRCVAIVDEADAVLLDQSRTPLVLSAAHRGGLDTVRKAEWVCRQLRVDKDVDVDVEHRRVTLTTSGVARCEELLGVTNLYTTDGEDWPHAIDNALRARALLSKDRDYVVTRGHVEVVDELTGRVVPGRRWADGLHQAVEAKEGVELTAEQRPVGRITVGGFFSKYDLLVGMSGTLEGTDEELASAYGIKTVAVPTHRPVIRRDRADAVFADDGARLSALVADVATRHSRGQPVLLGTTSITRTMEVSVALSGVGIEHQMLSAKNDAAEAAIIAAAGQPGAVTVATQMAGRGVDIVLGDEVATSGGLMVWGVEHHPAQRLDMQLRGRSGRQGDTGETRFAVAATDALVELGTDGGTPIDIGLAAVEGQQRAEALDRQLRDEIRTTEAVVDRLQDRLYEWRRRVSTGDIEPDLYAAVQTAAEAVAGGQMTFPGVGRPRLRRRPAIEKQLQRVLHSRRTEMGAATFALSARLLLQRLLVVLWGDELDQLEIRKQTARLSPLFGSLIEDWTALAVQSYRTFERTVALAWIEQLLSFRVGDATDASPGVTPSDPSQTDRTEWRLTPGVPDEDRGYFRTWEGWSFNRFIRTYFGVRFPEPPLVLSIDAIGDLTVEGHLVVLDLADPSRSVVHLAS